MTSYADEITINITSPTTNQTISVSGFIGMEIVRGIEQMPATFMLRTTDKYPYSNALPFNAYDACQILIGSDVVLTGYINEIAIEASDDQHEIVISGYSKCGDIVECAALFLTPTQLQKLKANPQASIDVNSSNVQYVGQGTSYADVKSMATALLAPFGITLSNSSTSLNTQLKMPQWFISLGDTIYETLEKAARFFAVLIYDDVYGNLVVSQVGNAQHTGSIFNGVFIRASVSYNTSERYNQHIAAYLPVFGVPDLSGGTTNSDIVGIALDKNVYRYRPRIIVSNQSTQTVSGIQPLALQEANWSCNRSIGRSQIINVTLATWRDAAGLLWSPNYLINVNVPSLKVTNQNLIISKVTYKKDIEEGTTAILELMPSSAFEVEPPDPSLLNQLPDLPSGTDTSNSDNTNSTPSPAPSPNIPSPTDDSSGSGSIPTALPAGDGTT